MRARSHSLSGVSRSADAVIWTSVNKNTVMQKVVRTVRRFMVRFIGGRVRRRGFPIKISGLNRSERLGRWKIGIGGALAGSLLPHHRAYGSVPRRFGWLNFLVRWFQKQRDAQFRQHPAGQGETQGWRTAVVPVALTATSGLCSKILADTQLPQLFEPTLAGFPLLPSITSQTAVDPTVQVSQHRRRLAEAEVASPADQVTA